MNPGNSSDCEFLDPRREAPVPPGQRGILDVVSSCPQCGSPIYGKQWTHDETPLVKFTCDCRLAVHNRYPTVEKSEASMLEEFYKK